MKRKNKIGYSITVPNNWWCGKKLGWVENEDLEKLDYKRASSCRGMKTFKKSLSHTSNLPSGTKISRFYYKKGIRYCSDFIKI
ncbi:MAG: hypothetical protein GQ540_03275 [Lutibacter sp.]|uniref:hypothetical protein n=1 Tax=Lutibacter sp. TaxID=1925666 RepID=UPI0019EF493D|nr:hypothetical protein [Lutibacter sp.]NOR27533.1 hypothetical protein [Lutibacter sp.]